MKHVILLIIATLGIMSYNQAIMPITSNDTANTLSEMSKIEIEQFNAKFTQYEGDNVRGATVNSMLQTVLANNMSTEDESRKVAVSGAIELDKNDTELPEKRADAGHKYKIKCNYENMGHNKGLVTSITIEEN